MVNGGLLVYVVTWSEHRNLGEEDTLLTNKPFCKFLVGSKSESRSHGNHNYNEAE